MSSIGRTPPQKPPEIPEKTPLQKHVEFFDFDGDARITPDETRMGLNALGMGGAQNLLTRTLINGTFGPPTTGSRAVGIKDIHKAKHAGDTGVFDKKGNFVQEKFDRIWRDFDTDKDGKLTEAEISRMTDANSSPRTFGRIATKGEFALLMNIAGQDDPVLKKRVVTRERLAALYDGSLFDKILAERTGFLKDEHAPGAAVARLARTSGGPSAGAAAGAEMGRALLVDDRSRTPEAAAPIMGGMRLACPYIGG